jgi:outer membrane lipoprotein SlyB
MHAVCAAVAALTLTAGSAAVAQTCRDCGEVVSVRFVEEKGKSSGLGAVIGGVAGGSGTGRTVATVAGAAGGAYAGNAVEKNKNKNSYWLVAIKMDGGNTRSFHYSSEPAVHEGERVKLVDGGRRLALIAK